MMIIESKSFKQLFYLYALPCPWCIRSTYAVSHHRLNWCLVISDLININACNSYSNCSNSTRMLSINFNNAKWPHRKTCHVLYKKYAHCTILACTISLVYKNNIVCAKLCVLTHYSQQKQVQWQPCLSACRIHQLYISVLDACVGIEYIIIYCEWQ